ncbi:MAG: tol-pal system protein YbgF [Rhodobacteraceae bacterium]|uniref:tol-pal system protein YbgF n=1 Tax=Amaricoccus sp. TaxID=1872485 RepID=UPI001D9C5DF8|nr:tol-pal system protein YbgF [Amaricoccus sp.]MCB1374998.1 tol-pal system protein YbgF [Paracoccaceae bacterium]MCB1403427.1 tol-pal system protein YbgF [Paracoccaceae bacterium]MCC0066367.1 tol-pal system protein YbgF [Rhodovulum sp.]HRW14715.1 tol-pal system protein YbgF [Amaricoccus sp.]
MRKAAHLATAAVLALALVAGAPAMAQKAQTVADIRAELGVLNGQVQQLRDQLVQSGAAGGLSTAPASALTRLDALEAELRRLTGRVEVLSNDLARILQDASNQIGDIEFRLTELEGGDTAVLGTPELLGGGFTRPMPRPSAEGAPGAASGTAPPPVELTVTEESDFDAAVAAAESGDNAKAVTLFDGFLATYPGSPFASEAQYRRGEALAAQGEWRSAARSFLDAFSGAPTDPIAPQALYRLAISLSELGQIEEACLTLNEVDMRYPGSSLAGDVAAKRASLRCQ